MYVRNTTSCGDFRFITNKNPHNSQSVLCMNTETTYDRVNAVKQQNI